MKKDIKPEELVEIVEHNSYNMGSDFDAIAEELIDLLYKRGYLKEVEKQKG